jgi:hypothetical protein
MESILTLVEAAFKKGVDACFERHLCATNPTLNLKGLLLTKTSKLRYVLNHTHVRIAIEPTKTTHRGAHSFTPRRRTVNVIRCLAPLLLDLKQQRFDRVKVEL